MKKFSKLCSLFAALLISGSVYAADNIKVEGAWSRATAPGQDAAMVDLTITSEQNAKLVSAASPACKEIEIHSMTHENGMMKMREVEFVDLPAGKRMSLGASGYHLMLTGLKSPLKAGDTLPVILNIGIGNKQMLKLEVMAEVKPLTVANPVSDDGTHHHMHH